LRKEAEELAKAKKRLLTVQQEAKAAKEIQRQKAEIAKLQEELRAIKAKQSLCPTNPHSRKATCLSLSPLHTPPSVVILSLTFSSLAL
jgi:lipid II:glycine glycyltransferase (peptidoglycan interpeptide bridge formation enzyme)